MKNTTDKNLMLSRYVFLALCLIFMPSSCFLEAEGLRTAKAEDVGMSAERLGRINTSMQRYLDRNEVPGVVTLVARRGRVVHFQALGSRQLQGNAPMSRDTIFRLASMTKPITSVAAMMLFEEGRFVLSDPIAKWLPEFSEMKVAETPSGDSLARSPYVLVPARRPITVRHLLTHTAGFANPYRGHLQQEMNRASTLKPSDTMAEVVRRVASVPLNFHPGDSWEYGPATDVLGRLIEVITGQSLDVFLRERIFAKLGMEDTHFYVPISKVSRLATHYRWGANQKIEVADPASSESRWVREPHIYFAGAGGLVSTTSDYYRFLQLMLNGGEMDGVRLLGRKTVELMTTNHTGRFPIFLNGPGFGFGLGFSVVTDVGATGIPGSLGNYGWGGAYGTNFWVDPAEGMIGIIMTQVNADAPLNIRSEFMGLAYQAIIDKAAMRSNAIEQE